MFGQTISQENPLIVYSLSDASGQTAEMVAKAIVSQFIGLPIRIVRLPRLVGAQQLVNMVKLFASEEIMKVAQHAVELHGGNGIMLDFGIEKALRDAVIFLHMDATVDISKFKIVKCMFPHTAGKYAGPE